MTEEIPRHLIANNLQINEELLPTELKNRLSTNDEKTLLVRCDKNIVTVENFYYQSGTIFKRPDNCMWFICHTWTGDTNTSNTIFINLSTGQKCVTKSLMLWRGKLTFSPDGNYLLIDAGIMASSARQIFLIDITDLNNINVIYREEIWNEIRDYECWFNNMHDLVTKYVYDNDDNDVRGAVVKTCVRRPNPKKVTPSCDEKWKEKRILPQEDDWKASIAKYQAQGLEWHRAHNKAGDDFFQTPECIAFYNNLTTEFETLCTVNEVDCEVGVINYNKIDV